ncbi:MAG: tetratricopeptide repeat protein [Armatimonadetes bacterium]|nr:tetratricopeptide repeat protein [Armatimonadota bacterium]
MYKKVIIVSVLIVMIYSLLMAEKSLERIANELAAQGDTFFTEGNFTEASKNFENAVQKLNEAVEKDGIPRDNDKISLWLTNAYNSYTNGSDFENAVRVLDERKKLTPTKYDLVKDQAIIYKKYLNNIPKAIEILKAYEDIKQTFNNEKRIGSYYLALEDYENSLIWYKKAYEQKQDSKVIKNIATLYLKLGDNQAAVKAYEDFIQTNPRESVLAKTYKNMGALYEELKNGTKANECYEKSNALKYDNNITLLLIMKYYDNKYYNKALEKIALLLENKPNNSDAIYYRAMIKFDRGEKDVAKADFTLLLNDSKYKKVAQGFIESIESE